MNIKSSNKIIFTKFLISVVIATSFLPYNFSNFALTENAAYAITCGFGSASGTECSGNITQTASTTFTLPSDWSDTNRIEVIGAGGSGVNGNSVSTAGGPGGGGGAYSKVTKLDGLTPGSSVNIK